MKIFNFSISKNETTTFFNEHSTTVPVPTETTSAM
jgi:hypothetical protein